jgi:hypothetical protein
MFGHGPYEYYFGGESIDLSYGPFSNHSNISIDGSCSDVLSTEWADR